MLHLHSELLVFADLERKKDIIFICLLYRLPDPSSDKCVTAVIHFGDRTDKQEFSRCSIDRYL